MSGIAGEKFRFLPPCEKAKQLEVRLVSMAYGEPSLSMLLHCLHSFSSYLPNSLSYPTSFPSFCNFWSGSLHISWVHSVKISGRQPKHASVCFNIFLCIYLYLFSTRPHEPISLNRVITSLVVVPRFSRNISARPSGHARVHYSNW